MRYLELAEDAEDLGEGSKYRENPVVRDPWPVVVTKQTEGMSCPEKAPGKLKKLRYLCFLRYLIKLI